jgi:hypothetical protein
MLCRFAIILMTTMFIILLSGGQTAYSANLSIPQFKHADVDITIDGKLDEAIWDDIPYHDDLMVVTPDTGEPARYKTHLRYFYTERGFYVGSWNEQPPETLLARLASRDSFLTRDGMQVTLDTSGEGLYGYWFSVYLGGSIGDGIVLPERRFVSNWDGPWYGDAAVTEDGWTAELFIPWAIMNMPQTDANLRRMGIYTSRSVGMLGERWSNPYLPSSQNLFLSALDTIELKNVAPRQEYNLFPYSSAAVDRITDQTDYKAGLDIFWRPTSDLQLSATLNPDFGQVEADDVVVNLTAFETFFPEKRLFFLENQEIFITTSRNSSDGTLLNTRRIGSSIGARRGGPDFQDGLPLDSVDTRRPVELMGALKATGQTGALRYGVLVAAEDDTHVGLTSGDISTVDLPGRDFGIVRMLYEDTSGGGRRALGWMGTVTDHPDRQAVTQGIDGHMLTRNGKLALDGQLFFSDVADEQGQGMLFDLQYVPKTGVRHQVEFDYFDEELNLNDLGFLPRTDRVSMRYRYRLRQSDVEGLRQLDTDFAIRETQNLDGRKTGGGLFAGRQWHFDNNSQTQVNLSYTPEYWDDRNSRGNGDYVRPATKAVSLGWNTDWAKPWTVSLRAGLSQEHEDGYNRSYRGEVIFRPNDRYSLRLRASYSERDAWLVYSGDRNFTSYSSTEWRPRLILDTFFTAKQQLRIQMEWVGIKALDSQYWQIPVGGGDLNEVARPETDTSDGFAISNITLQARYRWEIAPLSDLFVVYTRGGGLPEAQTNDSFSSLFSDTFKDPQSEFLVVKLRYRFGPA